MWLASMCWHAAHGCCEGARGVAAEVGIVAMAAAVEMLMVTLEAVDYYLSPLMSLRSGLVLEMSLVVVVVVAESYEMVYGEQ